MATANIGFEEQLWSMADKLRGSMDSGEYKNVVLGLLFLEWWGTDPFFQGFTNLWELGRLDLTVEALVLQKVYQSLFNEEERKVVLDRLKAYGFELSQDVQIEEISQIETNNETMNTWIFQGNPKIFDIDNYVKNHQYTGTVR